MAVSVLVRMPVTVENIASQLLPFVPGGTSGTTTRAPGCGVAPLHCAVGLHDVGPPLVRAPRVSGTTIPESGAPTGGMRTRLTGIITCVESGLSRTMCALSR